MWEIVRLAHVGPHFSVGDGEFSLVRARAAGQNRAMADTIVPDDKDWTWVLHRPCPECGFDATVIDATAVGDLIRTNAQEFVDVLAAPVVELRRRPDPATWSALEYAAHVCDVYRLYLERLGMMLDRNDPIFPNWDQDATAIAERYNEHVPSRVADDLAAAAEALAARFDAVTAGQWERPGRRSDGAAFTVDTFARYLIHDPVHHLHDIRRHNQHDNQHDGGGATRSS